MCASQMFDARVRAVLGPTNTGKTHLAMTRLLGHRSGIIGFPLRLLARENYDRMVAEKGAHLVALVTGEEKIVPPGARYFSCTVEAMPLERGVEFVAVDEIQLCADPDRGHIFTDRLLHARGLVETMFLGAETIRPLLQRLIPGAEIETRPRLSQLTYTGATRLTKLPPRSAVVAFSAAEVYAIAEAIRTRRGGCAVVMGRLSPRTRNAQVALYQNKEVDFLVATDAIGMGLNMDVGHVAFASLGKFDGSRPRKLTPPEIAQIAGRAGRGMRDGSFGTTGTCPPLPDEVVEAVEAHRFDPIAQIYWRNSELDFAAPDALLASLSRAAPLPGLVPGNEASDVETLAALAREPAIGNLARGLSRTRLLWDVCQIPDFRKIGDDSHTRLCARIFEHLARDARLPADWLAGSLDALDRDDGDIDTLMQRLSGVRIWAYVAARPDWTSDGTEWQERARAIEDKVSDALHERLTARFVDRRAAQLMRTLEGGDGEEMLSAVRPSGEVVVEGHSVGHASGFAFIPDPLAEGPEKRLVLRAARRALREEMPRRVAEVEAAADTAFRFAEDRRQILWNGAPIARLRAGAELLHPQVEVLGSEFLDEAQRGRIRTRLTGFVAAELARVFAPLHAAIAAGAQDAALRGPLHVLGEHSGIAPGTTATLDREAKARLRALGVRAGRFALFMPAMLRPQAAAWRATLLALRAGMKGAPKLPREGLVSLPRQDEARDAALSGDPARAPAMLRALGWVAAGPVLLRLDVLELVAGELAWRTRRRPVALPVQLASRLGLKGPMLAPVLAAIGFRLIEPAPLPEGMFGPPGLPMLSARRHPGPARPAQVTPAEPAADAGTARRPRRPKPPRPAAPVAAASPAKAKPARRPPPVRPPVERKPFVPSPDHPFAALMKLRERQGG